MRSKRGLLPLLVVSLLLSGGANVPTQPGGPILLKPSRRGTSIKIKRDPVVVRQSRVEVSLIQLQGEDNQRLRLPLFDGTELVLVRDETERPEEKAFVWEGEVEGQPGSMVILSNVGEALAGDVMTRDRKGALRFYQIRYAGNRVHVLNEIDQSKFPAEAASDEPTLPAPSQEPTPPTPVPPSNLCGDPASQIDVLVVYTDAARDALKGKDSITALIRAAVKSTNRSYAKSEIAQRLRLVHTQRVEYQESEKSVTDRKRLVNTSDGHLDQVLALRNSHAADVVVLIVDKLDDCGRSKVMPTVSPGNESEAYAVVPHGCAVSNYSFAHEIGHIMGARHDRDDDPKEGEPFDFNHGHVVRSPTTSTPWRTIMAKDAACEEDPPVGCSRRVARWSNPNVRFPATPSGDPTGTPDTDNHKALEMTALTVANFRCASP